MDVVIVDFEPRHRDAFRDLNLEWIERWFVVEEKDRITLDAPQETIIDRGGHILMAQLDAVAVGCCALIPMQDDSLELAKMAVSPSVQGRGVGRRLGEAAIARARARGVGRLFLDSNRVLTPAIALYRSLGFTELPLTPSPYARSDIQMELMLR